MHGWSEQTGMYSHLDNVEMTERCRNEHNLFGLSPREILRNSDNISAKELLNFSYPNDKDIEELELGVFI